MPVSSVSDVVESVEELEARLAQAGAAVANEDLTTEDARTIAASLEGVRGDARAIMKDLDATRDEDLLVVQDGAELIRLWTWHLETRRGLLQLVADARAGQDTASEFVGGQKRKVVVTREGDTLQRIAARELGDWREWMRLLEANPGISPGALPSGTTLLIPEKR